jgi:hypothetical protein
MEHIQNNKNLYYFHTGAACPVHSSNQNQPSNSNILQVNPEKVSTYTYKTESHGDQVENKRTEERQVAIADTNCILCKTSTAEIIKAYDNSASKKAFLILKVAAISITTTFLAATIVALIPTILGTFIMPSLMVGGSLAAVSLFFGLTATILTILEHRTYSHHLSYLRANLLINPMLSFMRNLAEQDEELNRLLSAGMTDQNIQKIADNITEQQDALIKQYKDLCTQLINISNLNKKPEAAEAIASVNPEIEEKLMQAKLIEAEQQKIAAEDKFYLATNELLCSLINNICANFATDKNTQEKINTSFLESFQHNPDGCTATFVKIVNKCLNINNGFSSIASDITSAVKSATNSTFDDLSIA